jgi:hypothetical protein
MKTINSVLVILQSIRLSLHTQSCNTSCAQQRRLVQGIASMPLCYMQLELLSLMYMHTAACQDHEDTPICPLLLVAAANCFCNRLFLLPAVTNATKYQSAGCCAVWQQRHCHHTLQLPAIG